MIRAFVFIAHGLAVLVVLIFALNEWRKYRRAKARGESEDRGNG